MSPLRRALALVVGGVLVLAGVALLVLPGPGLLLVLAGLLVLAREFPGLSRYVEWVEGRATVAAEESVSSRWRVAGSVVVALALVGAGVVWGVVPGLPLGGWSAGSGLILSGVVLAGLLYWSYRRLRRS
ncbi:PGPGW domain-containing protein [Streptomyces sp. SBT349]|uniref:PGPGW domain-containing protein n=1 Tax=Streptomyces sp. SBT349 TaxID=1580539 RepID=UPI003B63A72B